MKVYAEHGKIQEFLKENKVSGVEIVNQQSDAEFLITGRYSDEKFNDNLKGVIIPYTGHNGINLDDMREKNLMLFVTPTRSKYVAEKAITLMLSLLGNTIKYDQLLREGNWSSRNSDERVPWVSIQNSKIGLFGYGRIGKRIHRMLNGFNCKLYTIDRQKDYPNDILLVRNLEKLIESTDIIIISTPLNETTEGIFDKDMLAIMKDKYLINVGRGKVCNEKELYESLKNNQLRGYASDVWFHYPKGKETKLPSIYPIHDLDNVVLSNHSGGYTVNTNKEVNDDLLGILRKLSKRNYEDKIELKNLL